MKEMTTGEYLAGQAALDLNIYCRQQPPGVRVLHEYEPTVRHPICARCGMVFLVTYDDLVAWGLDPTLLCRLENSGHRQRVARGASAVVRERLHAMRTNRRLGIRDGIAWRKWGPYPVEVLE